MKFLDGSGAPTRRTASIAAETDPIGPLRPLGTVTRRLVDRVGEAEILSSNFYLISPVYACPWVFGLHRLAGSLTRSPVMLNRRCPFGACLRRRS